MSKLKATWSIDLKAMEHTDRGYHMDIEPGGLYEIWRTLDVRPKPAIAISRIPAHLDQIETWEVLVDGILITQRAGRIFRTGTAKPHPSDLEEIMSAMKEEIQHVEDQKILKLLSEMT
jgi:hypothetical protein